MFSFNDGTVHENVELVIDGSGSYKMERVQDSTVYCVAHSVIQRIGRSKPRIYSYIRDGKKSAKKKFSPLPQPVERRVLSYNGEDTSFLQVGPKQFTSLVFVVPGNPGLCEFYYDFVESLACKLPNTLVVAVSYKGFDVFEHRSKPSQGYGWNNLKVYSLETQIEHKLEFLSYILAIHPQIKHVAVLGHSVGSWIAQRVAVKHEEVQFVGLLAPTVHEIANSSKGKQFVELAKLLRPLAAFIIVSLLLLVVPFSHSVVRLVVKLLHPDVRKEAVDCAVALATTPAVTYQILGLATEEMKMIGGLIEPPEIAGFWDRQPVFALFAEDDHWVSQESQNLLIDHARRRPNVTTEVLKVSHAFCLKDSEIVGDSVAVQLNRWLKNVQ